MLLCDYYSIQLKKSIRYDKVRLGIEICLKCESLSKSVNACLFESRCVCVCVCVCVCGYSQACLLLYLAL